MPTQAQVPAKSSKVWQKSDLFIGPNQHIIPVSRISKSTNKITPGPLVSIADAKVAFAKNVGENGCF